MFRLLFLIWFSFHPVHVSLTSIDYIPETNDFKGYIKIYLDDFILDSKKNGYEIDQKKFIGQDKPSLDLLEKYLNDKLIITVNGKAIRGKLKEIDVADNEVNINLLFNNGKNPENIIVKNLIMTDLYQDQANMIIVKVEDFEQGVKLTPEMTQSTFKIK